MKRNKQNGLAVRVQHKKAPDFSRTFLRSLPAALLCAVGLGHTAAAVLPSAVGNGWAASAILFTAALCFTALRASTLSAWVLPGGIAALAVAAAVTFSPLRDGVCALVNDILTVLPGKTGRICLLLETTDPTHAVLAAIFLAVLAELLLCCGRIPALPVIALYLLGLSLGVVPNGWGAAAFLTGSVLLLFGGERSEQSSQAAAAAAACLALAAALTFALSDTSSVCDAASRAWHSLRYDSASNSMPEGQLENLGAWKKSDKGALSVTMEEPQKLYLRGMTGEVYTGTAWESLDTETESAWADAFYWLHKDGFNALTSVGTASELTTGSAEKSMTVRNLSACREHAYLPYALSAWDGLDETLIGDASASGTKTEELSYIPGSVPDWFTAQSALAVRQRGGEETTFLRNEELYRSYVSENYLALPEETAAAIARTLDLTSEQRTLSEIKDIILTALEEHITYSESTVTYTDGADFLTYVLERSGSGYSVHYATAATLMLRYFGVPARYVEGYFLPADEAAKYSSGDTIVLTEQNAHAWAEYYLDGVGWIPFETTPGYIDEEELNAGPGTGLTSERYYHRTEYDPPEEEEPDDVTENGGTTAHFRKSLAYVLLILLILLLLAAIVRIVLRRRRLRLALRRMEGEENRDAIASLYGYAALLLRHAKFGKEEIPGASEAAELNREALFSTHTMTDEQRSQMRDFAAETLRKCRETWNFPQRLYYQWIQCLYL